VRLIDRPLQRRVHNRNVRRVKELQSRFRLRNPLQ
jgi:hypothetical protein